MTELQLWTLRRVLDEQAIDVVFQPVVDLRTGQVAGYEALSRGPVGSELESAEALLDAARAADLVSELDWLCRILAIRKIRAADFDPRLTWFLNVEPGGLKESCPPKFLDDFDWARRNLRIVFEIVERALEAHVAGLIYAAELAREEGWGIALDDVGARRASVALLPLLEPDVIKLDGPLIRASPNPETAAITAAVRRYAETHGSCILAEGIETEEHERVALAYGARFGQGWRYGKPGPLPADGPGEVADIPRIARPAPTPGVTPFIALSEGRQVERGPKRLLLHISAHLEAESAKLTESAILLACFQDVSYLTEARLADYERLAEQNTFTVVAAANLPARITDREQSRFTLAGLTADSPMRSEWVVIVLNTEHAAAFVAKDIGDLASDGERRFDFVYTYDRSRVITAARVFLRQELLARLG